MGLFGRGGGQPPQRFRMKERAFAIGDDFWVEDEQGNRAYKVDGKALRMRKTFLLQDASGREVAKIQEKLVSVRDKMTVELDGRSAVISKRLLGIRERYKVEVAGGEDMQTKGNVLDHDYEVECDGHVVARISKKWFRARDTYGIEVEAGGDVPLIIAVAVCIDELAHD